MRLRLAAVCVLLAATPVAAQDHTTFVAVRPVAIGAAGTGLDAGNPVFRAYTGVAYNVRATTDGGEWPISFSLSNAPVGMTIDTSICTTNGPTCTAGTINWPSPTGTASNIVWTGTDRDGDTVQGTFTVTSGTTACNTTNGFCFVDAVSGNDTTGNGSLATPYQTIAKIWNTVTAADNILYFRTGTYPVPTAPTVTETTPGDCGRQVAWNGANRPVAWIGYPGETAVVNFGSDGGAAVPCMEFRGKNILLDNLTFQNIGSIGFQMNIRDSRYGIVARRNTWNNLRDGENGANSSFIMWSANDTTESYFDTIQNNTFDGIQGDGAGSDDGAALKMYSLIRPIIEDNSFANSVISEAVIALKAAIQDYTVRNNTCASTVLTCVGGNMADRTGFGGFQTRGEILHNNCKGSGTGFSDGCVTLGVHKVGDLQATYVYRNTFNGVVNIQNAIATDGPYTFTRNVIVNPGGSGSPAVCTALRATCTSITDSTRIVDSGNNLRGAAADNIIDAAGLLQGTYLTNFGPDSGSPTGHMVGTAEAPADAPTVTSASPNTGSTAGGNTIVITGTNFVAGATATVGGVNCPVGGGGTSTSLSCTTGAHAAGAVNIVVTNPDTQTGTGVAVFTYAVPPTPTLNRTRARGRMRAE